MEILLKDWFFLLFNKVFYYIIEVFNAQKSKKLVKKIEKTTCMIFSQFAFPISKLKWISRQNQAILEENEEKCIIEIKRLIWNLEQFRCYFL